MEESKIHEAIQRMIRYCDQSLADYNAAKDACEIGQRWPEYPMLSARSTLEALDYSGDDVEAVIGHIAAGGFDYCLDRTIAMTGHHEAQGERPEQVVCYWDPGQLKSRLQCLRNVPHAILLGHYLNR